VLSASPSLAGLGLPKMPLNTMIGPVFALYCPCGCHGHQFRHKKLSCGVVESLFEASGKKGQNIPFTQLIEVTSCIERLNSRIKAEEHRAQLTF